uniref:Uncharacterized protein n=1 Tax=Eutreptiella gymnastica TaxID=73025 RepID=A0A7S1II80_9EUGL
MASQELCTLTFPCTDFAPHKRATSTRHTNNPMYLDYCPAIQIQWYESQMLSRTVTSSSQHSSIFPLDALIVSDHEVTAANSTAPMPQPDYQPVHQPTLSQ